MVIRKSCQLSAVSCQLKNKRILITAGPTWVAIDSVRVISNIATGETGVLLAEKLSELGAKVTLVLGPVGACCLNRKIKLIKFKFFDELKDKVIQELKAKKIDIIIHSAAVSDFKPKQKNKGKLASNKKHNLVLTPLPKIVRQMRCLAPRAKLVMFKLESGLSKASLIQRASVARKKINADIIVANMINPYRAFILNKSKIISAKTKIEMVNKLIGEVS